MAFKLLATAEKRRRRINTPHLAEKVANGARFVDGIMKNETKKRKDAA